MRCIDAGRGVIRHPGVSDASDGVHRLRRSHSARTEIFFADLCFDWHPLTIISDRGSQFAPKVWSHMCSCLGIDRRMLAAFHRQKDGQTERINASMEQCLWVIVNHQQDDWMKWLPMAEFATHNGTSETNKCTSFFASQGVHCRTSLSGESTQQWDNRRFDQDQVQTTMQQIHDHLSVEMRWSQAVQDEGANKGRIPARNILEWSPGWLDTRHVRTTRPTRQSVWKWSGPFRVVRQVSQYAYGIDLPTSIWIHRVHPVSYLDPVVNNQLDGQQIYPPPPVEVDGEEEY